MSEIKYSLKICSFLFVVFGSVISTSVFVSTIFGNLILGTALVTYALVSDRQLTTRKPVIYILGLIFGWYFALLFMRGAAPGEVFRVSSYLFATFVCLLLIPSEIKFRDFALIYTYVISILSVIGILTKFGLSVTIFGGEVTAVRHSYPVYYFVGDSVVGESIRSIFINQNSFGPFAFFGIILTLYLYHRTNNRIYLALIPLNFAALYLTRSRSAMLALLVAIAVYALYVAGFPRLVALCSLGVVPGALTISAIGSGLLPDPLFVTDVTSNRVHLWEASVRALFESYLLGTGPIDSSTAIDPFVETGGGSSHNAFLAMFATGGLIGGIGYAFLLFYVLIMQSNHLTEIPAALVSITVGLVFLQLFEAYLLFGFTNLSVVSALAIGYTLQFAQGRWECEIMEPIQHKTGIPAESSVD